MSKWTDMADAMVKEDEIRIVSAGYGVSIEGKIDVANGRAVSALQTLNLILKHLDELDAKSQEGK